MRKRRAARGARPQSTSPDPRIRIVKRITVDDRTGCWLWDGYISTTGYGSIKFQGRIGSVHRLSYESFVGPIPEGLQIDHLCRVRACCNPEHLEPVTSRENTIRGFADRRHVRAGMLEDFPRRDNQ
jgi:hypothetical protein